jgi:ankyrin repeat protein
MGDIATLQALQAQGVAVDTRDFSGNTALMLAVRHRHATVVRTLLDMGADASLRNKDGLTALRMADQMGFADITQLLNAGP